MGFLDKAKEKSENRSNIEKDIEKKITPEIKKKIIKQETKTSLNTEFDSIISILKNNNNIIKLSPLSKSTGIQKEKILKILKILENEKIINMIYPINIFSDISIQLNEKKKKKKELELPINKDLIDTYKIEVNNVIGKVNIWEIQNEDVPIYELILPEIGIGTEALIEHMINHMAKITTIESSEITDPKKGEKVMKKLFKETRKELNLKISNISEDGLNFLTGIIVHEMYGLGYMEILMGDNWLEEIAINGAKVPISVYHKRFGWTKTNYFLKNEEEIYNFASQVGRKVGRQINSLNPLMDAHLTTGDRIAATLSPISSSGNTITIRRFSRNPWTIIHLIDPKIGTMSIEVAAFLWLCIQYELNIMVAGGTASGKTSVLNSVCSLIPANQRILSIEDTREISLPDDLHWNWVPLSSRKANPEGQGGVSMLDLMVESLRMRPDRIIVGEIRRKDQAETLFETMHTGHSVYTTMHADTVEQVERRLIEPPIEIPKSEIGALHLVVIQYRDRRKGSRKTLEVAEILSQETDEKSLSLNYLFRWKARTDTFEKINESIRVMEELNLHTGMTQEDINSDLKKKELILKWMLKHDVKDVDTVGKIMKMYYKHPELIFQAANENRIPKEVVNN